MNELGDSLIELSDVMPISVLFRCPGAIRSSTKEKVSTTSKTPWL
jgi:hypothetical protein